MIRLHKILAILLCCGVAASCNDDDGPNLPSVEERVNEAISGLRSELTTPENGWQLEYSPTPDAGVFFMLLDFDDNGDVRIQSDIADNDGEFYDETITYRIDNALGLELILETYGVFHYLFEQEQSTFGAEFEFIFDRKDGDNLLFNSATDFGTPTVLTFTPAAPGASASFSREIAENFDAFGANTSQIFGGDPPVQQIILEDRNISLFWSIDLARRTLLADIAGVGTTFEEVVANGLVGIGQNTGYFFRDGGLVLTDPVSFVAGGQQFTITTISLTDFEMTGPPLCESATEPGPSYRGQISGVSNVRIINSLLNSSGFGFRPNNAYTVNVFFVFDGDGNSLSEGGIIEQRFPGASGFAFLYGINPIDPNLPSYSVGLLMDDGSIYVRGFEPTTSVGNRVSITLTEDFYFDDGATGLENDLRDVTDAIFEGGEVYASQLPDDNATVFRLFNPCNRYELFLVSN